MLVSEYLTAVEALSANQLEAALAEIKKLLSSAR
jgi:hypothetical protein